MTIEERMEQARRAARERIEAHVRSQEEYRRRQERECLRINDIVGMMREMGYGPGWRPLLDPYDR